MSNLLARLLSGHCSSPARFLFVYDHDVWPYLAYISHLSGCATLFGPCTGRLHMISVGPPCSHYKLNKTVPPALVLYCDPPPGGQFQCDYVFEHWTQFSIGWVSCSASRSCLACASFLFVWLTSYVNPGCCIQPWAPCICARLLVPVYI